MNMETNQKNLINATLLSFKITTYDFEEIKGATVTLYKFRPQLGVRVSKIRGLKDELAAALGVPSVRIIAPLPDGSVGIEVPNKQKPVLPLNSIGRPQQTPPSLSKNSYFSPAASMICFMARMILGVSWVMQPAK